LSLSAFPSYHSTFLVFLALKKKPSLVKLIDYPGRHGNLASLSFFLFSASSFLFYLSSSDSFPEVGSHLHETTTYNLMETPEQPSTYHHKPQLVVHLKSSNSPSSTLNEQSGASLHSFQTNGFTSFTHLNVAQYVGHFP